MFLFPGPFEYFEPRTMGEATALLARLGEKAAVLAGGCELIPAMRRRKARPESLVSIVHLPGLDRLESDGSTFCIGAMATLRAVEDSPVVRADFSALFEGVQSIASVQVKTTGTLVGNLCVATPASDIAPPLMVLGAELRIAGPDGERRMPVGELFRGAKQHSLRPGEIATEVRIPAAPAASGSAFAKLTRTAADCAKLNVAALVSVQDGRCADARIALGAVASTPVRAAEAEEILRGHTPSTRRIEWAAAKAVEHVRPITDLRSTAEYRKTVLKVLIERVLRRAWERALGEAT